MVHSGPASTAKERWVSGAAGCWCQRGVIVVAGRGRKNAEYFFFAPIFWISYQFLHPWIVDEAKELVLYARALIFQVGKLDVMSFRGRKNSYRTFIWKKHAAHIKDIICLSIKTTTTIKDKDTVLLLRRQQLYNNNDDHDSTTTFSTTTIETTTTTTANTDYDETTMTMTTTHTDNNFNNDNTTTTITTNTDYDEKTRSTTTLQQRQQNYC